MFAIFQTFLMRLALQIMKVKARKTTVHLWPIPQGRRITHNALFIYKKKGETEKILNRYKLILRLKLI